MRGLFFGVLWIGIGIFLLMSAAIGYSSYRLPKLDIELGWVVLALGVFRLWWWWYFEDNPYRKELEKKREMLEGQENQSFFSAGTDGLSGENTLSKDSDSSGAEREKSSEG